MKVIWLSRLDYIYVLLHTLIQINHLYSDLFNMCLLLLNSSFYKGRDFASIPRDTIS